MSNISPHIEKELFDSRISKLQEVINAYRPFIKDVDHEYLAGYIANIKEAFVQGYFNESDHKNIPWNQYNFYRYSWYDALTGIISEVQGLGHTNACVTIPGSFAVLAPSDRAQQVSGVDIVMYYPAQEKTNDVTPYYTSPKYTVPAYTVSIQVKTGTFAACKDGDGATIWIHPDWVKNPAPTGSKYHRIIIVDEINGYILTTDYEVLRGLALRNNTVTVGSLRKLNKSTSYRQLYK